MTGLVEQFIQARAGDLSHRALLARVRSRRFPAAALDDATHSPDGLVREIVASLEIPPPLLAALAHDCDPVVRLAVACNLFVSDDVLIALFDDADEMVRLSARAELQLREWIRPS